MDQITMSSQLIDRLRLGELNTILIKKTAPQANCGAGREVEFSGR